MQGAHLANKLTQLVRARPDIDVHGLTLGMRVNELAGERGFENRQTCAHDTENLNSRRAQHQVVNELVETELSLIPFATHKKTWRSVSLSPDAQLAQLNPI